MAMSLLNILGGAADIASLAKGEKEQASFLPETAGDNFFETVMQGQASQQSATMAQQALAAKAQGHGITMLTSAIALPEGAAQATTPAADAALSFLQGIMQRAEQLLPEGAEIPQWFRDRLAQPQGEAQPLTEQELSELAAETGLPSALLLAVLEPTPLANPALALQVSAEDIAEAAGFAQNVLASPSTGQKAAQQAQLQQAPASGMETTGETADETSADVDALLAKLAQLPAVKEGEAKTAYAQLAQWVDAAKALQKPTPAREHQPHVKATQTQQEKPAVDNTTAEPVIAEAADIPAEEGGEAKIAPSQQQGASSSGRAEGTGNTALQGIQGQETRMEQTTKAESPAQPRLITRHVEAPVQEVTVHLAKAVKDGVQRLEIQLRPEALGKVEFVMETDKDGVSRVQITAEKRETLEMFQRDARNLERILQDAGIKTENNQLSFNLRGGDSHQGKGNEAQQQNQADDSFAKTLQGDDAVEDRREISETALGYDAGRSYRLNLDWGVDISV